MTRCLIWSMILSYQHLGCRCDKIKKSMKKYLFKIIPVFLAIVIFPMASGLCFQNFSGSILKTEVAIAATMEYRDSGVPVEELDVCGNEAGEVSTAVNNFAYQLPTTSRHNSLLPCCLDNAHTGLTILSQSLVFDKFVATAAFISGQTFSENLKAVIYHNPIIPPPELSMVKTTVLRL